MHILSLLVLCRLRRWNYSLRRHLTASSRGRCVARRWRLLIEVRLCLMFFSPWLLLLSGGYLRFFSMLVSWLLLLLSVIAEIVELKLLSSGRTPLTLTWHAAICRGRLSGLLICCWPDRLLFHWLFYILNVALEFDIGQIHWLLRLHET